MKTEITTDLSKSSDIELRDAFAGMTKLVKTLWGAEGYAERIMLTPTMDFFLRGVVNEFAEVMQLGRTEVTLASSTFGHAPRRIVLRMGSVLRVLKWDQELFMEHVKSGQTVSLFGNQREKGGVI